MNPKIMIRSYCLIGIGDIEDIKEDLIFISESNPNYVGGKGILISTFTSTLHIVEIEEFLNMNERSFLIFEMTPGFFSANLKDKGLQQILFGGKIDNSNVFSFKMEENLRELMKEDMIPEDIKLKVTNNKVEDITPTLDDLLDKINDIGVKNLTEKEIKLLKKYSK
jgi:hypothetical protein